VTDIRDELLERVVDELRTLPPVDEGAVAKIVRAAAADAVVVRGARSEVRGRWWWESRIPLAAAAGLTLAAGLAGYAVRGGSSPAATVAAVRTPAEALALASSDLGSRTSDLAVPTQFVLDAPHASRVALVGDFNAWDTAATPLTRVASSGIWTVTVPLAPGRHTYAFMVDGATWTLDPRAPTAQDPDFGTPSSVVLVGTP
jgi:Carbohydrate-binding module 48 (Isoamylase N-terminal domain)